MSSLDVMIEYWRSGLKATKLRRERETFQGAAEVQDEMIALYERWIARAERILSKDVYLEAAE